MVAAIREIDFSQWDARLISWAAWSATERGGKGLKSTIGDMYQAPATGYLDDDDRITYNAQDAERVESLIVELAREWPIGAIGIKSFYLGRKWAHVQPYRDLGRHMATHYTAPWHRYGRQAADYSDESLARRLIERSQAILDIHEGRLRR